jgi:hypothetical protein
VRAHIHERPLDAFADWHVRAITGEQVAGRARPIAELLGVLLDHGTDVGHYAAFARGE